MDGNQSPTPKPTISSSSFQEQLTDLRRRLTREATLAVRMLESALDALWSLDADKAELVRDRDDSIDSEEVAIEQGAFSLLALQQPYGRDFRTITFIIKVNADLERVADHACSIAKVTKKLKTERIAPRWPVTLRDMGDRIQIIAHELLRIMLDEDVDAARDLMAGDKTIDRLDRRLFDDTVEMLSDSPHEARSGLMIYRVGRELERVGDLLANIAEDVVYLRTGKIVRHQKQSARHDTP